MSIPGPSPVPRAAGAIAPGLLCTLLLLPAGCLPTRSAYLSVPLVVEGPLPKEVVLDIPRQELEPRLGRIDPAGIAVYLGSRSPLPLVPYGPWVETHPAGWRISTTVDRPRQRLLIISPGPTADRTGSAAPLSSSYGGAPADETSAVLLWEQAWR